LVKGAFIIAGYTLVLALHFFGSLMGWKSFSNWLMIAGIPLSTMTAVYTAYLFAQAKARDMWQNPLLPPHLLVQAILLGSAILLPAAIYVGSFNLIARNSQVDVQ
jgi:Ni/Fe-hydrogenase subunit HybB-like protein